MERYIRVARADPGVTAVVERGGVALTHGALVARAAGLAAELTARGVGRGDLVGIGLEKSADWLVAWLGAWWAGAAFLPLDPSLPAARRAAIVADARPAVVVARPEARDDFARLGVPVVGPDDDRAGEFRGPARAEADDLAYLIYTSGSLGRPKGVMVAHRGIVPVLDAQIAAFHVHTKARVLWLLSPSFDASLSDLGVALLSGAAVHLEAEEELRAPGGLFGVLERRRITHVDLPPALLRMHDPNALPHSVETIVIGGEPSPPEVVRRWAARVRLVNVYGPTEATICTSLGRCDPTTWDRPLLGRPIAGMRYQVVDEHLGPVAPGVPGELCIEGPGLALGYLGLPELTASKFVEQGGTRRYRTGDRVVARADGEFAFLGRVDRQVKVHGRLVEPHEVEARLLEHPEVHDAAVVKRRLNDRSCREGLVAFVVGRCPPSPRSASELRQALGRTIPAWMVPVHVAFLPELPRLSSGKVDLAALTDRPLERAAAEPTTAEPGSTRARLAEVWRTVLGLDAVSESESFFAQGGDSLALLEAVAALHARGLLVPPSLLAEGRTIAEISQWLEDRGHVATAEAPPPGAIAVEVLREESTSPKWRHFLTVARDRPDAHETDPTPRSVLLTGGTGQLGARLLGELLARTDAEFFVLVRAQDAPQARARWLAAIREQEIVVRPGDADRVHTIPGDVSRERFGWTRETWVDLCRRVDTIHHNAAEVNLVAPYAALRAANVVGTGEVLRFQATGRVKRLHHASTLSVFVATNQHRGRLVEADDLSATRWVCGGYAQTKWAAEWLVRSAAGATGPAVIYRLGLITGDSQTGRASPRDFLSLFLRGLARLGSVPEFDGDLWLDTTPIDFAAGAMARLSLASDPGSIVRTYHLANPPGVSLREVVAALRGRGASIEELPPALWHARVQKAARDDPEAAAACLALCRASSVGGNDVFQTFRSMDLFQATDVVFDASAARAGLAETDLPWPPPGRVLLERYLDADAESGGRG